VSVPLATLTLHTGTAEEAAKEILEKGLFSRMMSDTAGLYIAELLTAKEANLDNGFTGDLNPAIDDAEVAYGRPSGGTGTRFVYHKLVHSDEAIRMSQTIPEVRVRAMVACSEIFENSTCRLTTYQTKKTRILGWDGKVGKLQTGIVLDTIRLEHRTNAENQARSCRIAYHFEDDKIILDGILLGTTLMLGSPSRLQDVPGFRSQSADAAASPLSQGR